MYISTQTIITAGAVIGALFTIFGIVFAVYRWYLKQEGQDASIKKLKDKHDEDIKEIKAEQRVICESMLACLDGLEQLGCNHSVPKAKARLEEHLNKAAHN